MVEAVGADVNGFKPGDRVYIAGDNTGAPRTGLYAEQALCAPTQLHGCPTTSPSRRAPRSAFRTARRIDALFKRASAQPGETVLVHGASGGVGIAAVEIARAHGMTVIGTGGTERGMQLVREHGAHLAVNHTRMRTTSTR